MTIKTREPSEAFRRQVTDFVPVKKRRAWRDDSQEESIESVRPFQGATVADSATVETKIDFSSMADSAIDEGNARLQTVADSAIDGTDQKVGTMADSAIVPGDLETPSMAKSAIDGRDSEHQTVAESATVWVSESENIQDSYYKIDSPAILDSQRQDSDGDCVFTLGNASSFLDDRGPVEIVTMADSATVTPCRLLSSTVAESATVEPVQREPKVALLSGARKRTVAKSAMAESATVRVHPAHDPLASVFQSALAIIDSSSAMVLYLFVWVHGDILGQHGRQLSMSFSDIAQRTKMGKRTVQDALHRLETLGLAESLNQGRKVKSSIIVHHPHFPRTASS